MAILPNKLHVGYLTFTVLVLSGRLKNQIIKADISPLILTPVYQKPIYRVGICTELFTLLVIACCYFYHLLFIAVDKCFSETQYFPSP